MNMSMRLGNATMMASDSSGPMYDKPKGFRVSIAPGSGAEFDRVYEALARDAEAIIMPPGETFWAERFAMFNDRYGTPWMLNYSGNKASN
jgi:PhnB protein